MVVKTAGELNKFYYVDESTYGTTPSSAMAWGGEIISITPSIDMRTTLHTVSGSRAFGASTRGGADIGYNLKAWARSNSATPYNWVDFWAYYGLGSTSGTATHLDSFTGQVSTTTSGTTNYDFYNGCKFNALTLSASAVGEPIVFEGDIYAQYLEQTTGKTLSGLQSVTVAADPSNETGDIITWDGTQQINIAAGGLTDWYPQSWNLSITNNLARKYGFRTGNDTNTYKLALGLNEGKREITLSVELPYEDTTYTAAKLAGSAVTSLTIPVDNKTITLSDGVFPGNDFPEYHHDLMSESVKIMFQSISIA